ncbi:MAG: helix-turn-helix transcriptional regulator [Cyclobacteriaceae bacterium]|nr:helix-turn-helix transcriptional regulator [Cyclobacteriaceae bacterium]
MKNRDKKFQVAFGRHVKRLRDERGWSQEQLAAMSNIDVNQISRIENGRHAASLHTIKALAVALGKYPDELLRFDFDVKLNTDFNIRNTKSKRPQTTTSVAKLSETDFFNSPKSVAQIISQCKKLYQVSLKSSAVSGILRKLVNQRKLKRIPSPTNKAKYLYQKKP